MIKKIVDWIFYKLSVVALFILCISTVVMIVSLLRVLPSKTVVKGLKEAPDEN